MTSDPYLLSDFVSEILKIEFRYENMQFFAQIFSSRVARLKKWSFCFSWICLLFQPSCSYSGNVSLRYLFVDYYWSVLAALRRCDRLVVSVGWFGAICDFAYFIFNQVTTGSFIKHKVIRNRIVRVYPWSAVRLPIWTVMHQVGI